jgi:UMF1 family MFS transporter
VVTTFVFAVYLTSESFGDEDIISAQLGYAVGIAGVIIAVLAPITGQRSDRAGRRKLWLGIHTGLVVIIIAALFFVQPAPEFLLLGLVLIAAGNIFFEFAQVNYNAMLSQVSTKSSIGRVSGFGWGLGYLGGIVLLVILLVGFIFPDVGWFGVTSENGMQVRVAMLVAAAWFGVFAVPLFFAVPEIPRPDAARAKVSIFGSYKELFATLRRLAQESRQTVWFLLASAVFRDGLAGVFTFGGIIAARVFGFDMITVLVFAIVANVVAGVFTLIAGRLDDVFGAKPVIVFALIGSIVAGIAMFAFHQQGVWVFWATGLTLSAFVGPIQASSRGFLLRLTPTGREGEIFGLYATAGRAVSFLAPVAFAVFVDLSGATIFGVLGITLVLLVGLLLLIPVKATDLDARQAVTRGAHPQ